MTTPQRDIRGSGTQDEVALRHGAIGDEARALLFLASAGWALSFTLPTTLMLLLGWFLMLAWAASCSLLLANAFTLSVERFALVSSIALYVMLAALLRRSLRKVLQSRQAKSSGAQHPLWPLVRWLPSGGKLALVWLGAVGLAGWAGHRLVPPELVATVAMAAAHFLVVVATVVLLRIAWRWTRWIYRFGSKSRLRVGIVSTLLLLLTIAAGRGRSASAPVRADELPFADSLLEIGQAPTGAEAGRRLLLWFAEITVPEKAFTQDALRFLIPLVDQARDDGLAFLDGSLAYASLDWPDGEGGDPARIAFQRCMNELWPKGLARVEGVLRLQFRHIARDEVHDVALSALLDVCEASTGYDDVAKAFVTAALNLARDGWRKDGRRRVYCEVLPETARCPLPWENIENRIAAQSDLAQIEWCSLKPLERAVIVERAVWEYDYDEIAEHHPRLDRQRVKDLYTNTLKKVRDKLGGRCLK